MQQATVIIQARTGSSRLPNKVLMPLAGKPVLEHVVRRCQRAQRVDRVIVATTIDPQDRAVLNCVKGLGVESFAGSVQDVLDRYFQAAKIFGVKHIVRITADCPMIDPEIIDLVVGEYFESGVEYASNILEATYPDGEDVEVFSFETLSRVWKEAQMLTEREHVTPYIRMNDFFNKINISHEENWGHHRWTLDHLEDYKKISAIFDVLYSKNVCFHMNEIVRFLQDHPEIDQMNMEIKRNDGF